jgi:hypothetical protein
LQDADVRDESLSSKDPLLKLAVTLYEFGGGTFSGEELVKNLASDLEMLAAVPWLDNIVMPTDSGNRDLWFTRFEKEWQSPLEVVFDVVTRELKDRFGRRKWIAWW